MSHLRHLHRLPGEPLPHAIERVDRYGSTMAAVDARSKVSQLKELMAQQQAAMDEIDLLLRSEGT